MFCIAAGKVQNVQNESSKLKFVCLNRQKKNTVKNTFGDLWGTFLIGYKLIKSLSHPPG